MDSGCGISCWHPYWMRKFANTRWFMIVYGLLGTIQATSYLYFVITLTTIEKRFKIPSQTTGETTVSFSSYRQSHDKWFLVHTA